jgi:putative ABC transport system permease protein
MRQLRAWFLRLGASFGRNRNEKDFAAELENHLRLHIEDNLRSGMSAEEARRKALIKLGGIEQTKESYRERRGLPFLETLFQDVRFGARMLRKNPGFTAVAVLTLALGIGANGTIFSLVHAMLLRNLPYSHPEKIVMVWEKRVRENMLTNTVSPADYLDWKSQNSVFEKMAELSYGAQDLLGGEEPLRVSSGIVGAQFFDVLGVQPALGRFFSPSDELAGSPHVAVLTYGLWQRRFGGDPTLVGKAINVNGESWTVIGVLPGNFEFPYQKVELWTPLQITEEFQNVRGAHYLSVFARLKPGVRMQQAQREMDGIAARLETQNPGINRGHGASVLPLREELVSDVRPALQVLSIAVGFVLLIACANVSNLLLANTVRRQREMAVRQAIGATRWRLVRQLLAESLLLAILAGGAGFLLASWGIWGLGPLLEYSGLGIPLPAIRMNYAVLGFLAIVSATSCVLAGLAPALNSSRTNLLLTLKGEGTLATLLGGNRRLRSALLVTEVALSTLLLVGAGLMLRTFLQLRSVEPGFTAARVVTLPVMLNGARYKEDQTKIAFFAQLTGKITAIPGVESSGAAGILPLSGHDSRTGITIENRAPDPNEPTRAHHRVVTPGYLETMNIPLLAGRTIQPSDTSSSPPVAVINQTAARRYWPGQDAVGRRFRVGREQNWREIVGVVGDVKEWGLDQRVNPEMYLPLTQDPTNWMNIVVRTNREPADIGAALTAEVRALDKDQPTGTLETMNELVSRSIAPRAVNLVLMGLFAVVALVLAAAGIYGVLSNLVSQLTREIGVRVALGAQSNDVLRMILGHCGRLVFLGLALGIAGSLALSRLMQTLLYGVSAVDPVTLSGVTVLLALTACLACYVPARRAMRVDPMVALRYE